MDGIPDSMDMSLSKLTKDRKASITAGHGVAESDNTTERAQQGKELLEDAAQATLPLPPPVSVPVAAASALSPALAPLSVLACVLSLSIPTHVSGLESHITLVQSLLNLTKSNCPSQS